MGHLLFYLTTVAYLWWCLSRNLKARLGLVGSDPVMADTERWVFRRTLRGMAIIFALVTLGLWWDARPRYVASQDGGSYHRLDCEWVQNIPADKRQEFSSRDDAERNHTRCLLCRP
jgi:hypothetical protein